MRITFDWDAEASVWVATSADVPGLVLEARSFREISEKVRVTIPTLLRLNRAMMTSGPDFPDNPYAAEGRKFGMYADSIGLPWKDLSRIPKADHGLYRVLLRDPIGIMETTAYFYRRLEDIPNLDDETEESETFWVKLDAHGEAYFVDPIAWRDM